MLLLRIDNMQKLVLGLAWSLLLSIPAAAQTEPEDPASTARMRLGPLGLTPAITLQNMGIDSNVFGLEELCEGPII